MDQENNKTKRCRIVICVSPELNDELRERAWQERKSVSQLVREYCIRGLESKPAQN
jgi:hypothetical protein